MRALPAIGEIAHPGYPIALAGHMDLVEQAPACAIPLERLSQLGPPIVRLDAQAPEWLRAAAAYADTCERERRVYLEIERLSGEISDAREQAKADLLLELGNQHPVVLAFDSVLVTLADFQRRLRSVTERDVVLATGSDTAGRKRVIRAAARGAAPSKPVIALCSDTMSEGLNLQGAFAVVHLDMPSVIRVAEQRGRVDRLDSPHSYVDIWWPQDAAEFTLRQDERCYARYEFVADVHGSNFSVPRLDGAPSEWRRWSRPWTNTRVRRRPGMAWQTRFNRCGTS
jgi:hypothetical protein